KQALMGAESEGAEAEILRLTDYKIQPCRGCGLCLFRENVCQVQDDDVSFIFSKVDGCDGMLLGAPCYFLELTAVAKQLIDRCWILGHKIGKIKKPATVIIPYATRGWIPYVSVQSNILLNVMGLRKINEITVCTQGISEVVLDDEAMDLAYRLGKEIAVAIRKKDFTYKGEAGICPSCHDWLVRILRDNETVECPTCGVRGKLCIINGKISVQFEEKAWADGRFRPEGQYNHFTYHIAPSKDYFLRTKEERKIKTQKYKEYLKTQGD
ncbi:MAG: flavodoxin family protein, partial [Deltaproteobacteria bacterium]|nr:flavodoxin family protein [Deltaproteobacteria bacterium]